jgi:hypothetical protein
MRVSVKYTVCIFRAERKIPTCLDDVTIQKSYHHILRYATQLLHFHLEFSNFSSPRAAFTFASRLEGHKVMYTGCILELHSLKMFLTYCYKQVHISQ